MTFDLALTDATGSAAICGPRDAEPTRLPKAVIEHPEALGYVDPEPD